MLSYNLLGFDLHFLWWLVAVGTFSGTCFPFAYFLLWKNICSCPLPIFFFSFGCAMQHVGSSSSVQELKLCPCTGAWCSNHWIAKGNPTSVHFLNKKFFCCYWVIYVLHIFWILISHQIYDLHLFFPIPEGPSHFGWWFSLLSRNFLVWWASLIYFRFSVYLKKFFWV